jgi:hypothetical protein
VEKSILHIELLNWPVTANSNGEHCTHGGRFHNQAERLIVVHTGALSETPEDPTSSQVLLLMRALYSSSIAARQLGSASAARTEDGIGDGIEAVKVNGFVAIRKPSLAS